MDQEKEVAKTIELQAGAYVNPSGVGGYFGWVRLGVTILFINENGGAELFQQEGKDNFIKTKSENPALLFLQRVVASARSSIELQVPQPPELETPKTTDGCESDCPL